MTSSWNMANLDLGLDFGKLPFGGGYQFPGAVTATPAASTVGSIPYGQLAGLGAIGNLTSNFMEQKNLQNSLAGSTQTAGVFRDIGFGENSFTSALDVARQLRLPREQASQLVNMPSERQFQTRGHLKDLAGKFAGTRFGSFSA